MENLEHFKEEKLTTTDLKYFSIHQLEALSEVIRQELIEATSTYGGHLSSNLGVVELTIAIHRSFSLPQDRLLFDVGHQAYVHKLLTGRSLSGLRTANGTSGYQKFDESPFDQFEAGHSSTSLSAAEGMAIARDLNHEYYEVIAFIGDASISNGMAFEALNHIGQSRNKVIIVLNDNEMSITPPVGALSRLFRKMKLSPSYLRTKAAYKRLMFKTKFGYFIYKITWNFKNFVVSHLIPTNIFDDLGFSYIGPIDGHNFKALDKAFKIAKRTNTPTLVHVKTIKGKGYKYSEKDKTGYWHGVTPFDIESGKPKHVKENMISWSHLYADLTKKMMQEHPQTVLVTPATLKGSGLEEIFDSFRERTFDVGIAEEHAITMSAGLGLAGKHPIISIYSTFMQRSYDQIVHDLARMNVSATILVDRAGLVGADGETHQGIFDESFLYPIPNVSIAMASSLEIAHALMQTSLLHHGPFFIRYPREYLPTYQTIGHLPLNYGQWLTTHQSKNKKLAMISFGPILNDIFKAIEHEALDVTLINAVYQKPIDEGMLESLLPYDHIIIHQAYSVEQGFVSKVKDWFMKRNYQGKIETLVIPDAFITQASISEQMASCGVDVKSVIQAVKNHLK